MTTTMKRKDLEAAATLAARFTGRALPVLSMLRLGVGTGVALAEGAVSLSIRATDLTAEIALAVPTRTTGCGGKPWQALVSPRHLLAALRLRPDAEVISLEIVDGRLALRLGEVTSAKLPTQDAAEFPPAVWTDDDAVDSWAAGPGALAAAVQMAATAASQDDTRGKLEALHLARAGRELALSATDGKRVHQCRVEVTEAGRHSGGVEDWKVNQAEALLPSEATGRLRDVLAAIAAGADDDHPESGEAVCIVGATALRVEGWFLGGWQSLVLKQREGTFPDVRKVFPSDDVPALRLELEADALSLAVAGLRRLETADGRKPMAVRLRVLAESQELEVDSGAPTSAEAWAATRVALAAAPEGPQDQEALRSCALDAQFADEWLQSAAAAGGRITLRLRGRATPVTLERERSVAVIMPMAL